MLIRSAWTTDQNGTRAPFCISADAYITILFKSQAARSLLRSSKILCPSGFHRARLRPRGCSKFRPDGLEQRLTSWFSLRRWSDVELLSTGSRPLGRGLVVDWFSRSDHVRDYGHKPDRWSRPFGRASEQVVECDRARWSCARARSNCAQERSNRPCLSSSTAKAW